MVKAKKVSPVAAVPDNAASDASDDATADVSLATTPKKSNKRVSEASVTKKTKVPKTEQDDDTSTASSDDDDEEDVPEAADSDASEEEQDDDAVSDDEDIAVDVKPTKNTPSGISVFVGNLPSNIKRQRLIKLFAPHAAVKAVRFRRNDGGQLFNVKTAQLPSVIAFVDVATEELARAAVDGLNGTDLNGHVLRVQLQRNAKTAESIDEKRTICVGNLAYAVTDELLHATFECCGEIEYVRTLQEPKGCSGIGFVCFAEAASVPMAFELNGGLLLERPVRVSRYQARKKPAVGKPTKRHQTFGAQRRMAVKEEKKAGKGATSGPAGKFPRKGGADAAGADKGKKKKSEFTGAKVSDKKKSKGGDKKKKGGLKGEKLLAKKIAPRQTA